MNLLIHFIFLRNNGIYPCARLPVSFIWLLYSSSSSVIRMWEWKSKLLESSLNLQQSCSAICRCLSRHSKNRNLFSLTSPTLNTCCQLKSFQQDLACKVVLTILLWTGRVIPFLITPALQNSAEISKIKVLSNRRDIVEYIPSPPYAIKFRLPALPLCSGYLNFFFRKRMLFQV